MKCNFKKWKSYFARVLVGLGGMSGPSLSESLGCKSDPFKLNGSVFTDLSVEYTGSFSATK